MLLPVCYKGDVLSKLLTGLIDKWIWNKRWSIWNGR